MWILDRLLTNINTDLSRIVVSISWNSDDLSDLEVLIILLEDRRFFQHRGIDFRSVARETWKMCTLQKHGGASTIDMQFIRTRTNYKDRTLKRKIYEMLLARILQYKMDKVAILRAYLQEMYLGSGIYGIEDGAQMMFQKRPYELERSEAAIIAAMMVYPRPLIPSSSWKERVSRRAAYGLKLFDAFGPRYKQHFE